jgi:phospholipid-translocating P-type ATPase (flippase)
MEQTSSALRAPLLKENDEGDAIEMRDLSCGSDKGTPRSSSAFERREVYANDSNGRNRANRYANNFIQTAEYNIFTFLPKFLYMTFSRINNAYFFGIGILQMIPAISNTGNVPMSWFPLFFVVGIDAIVAILEDYKRHKADRKVNESTAHRYSPELHSFQDCRWKDLQVGDIVEVRIDEMSPCDILLLSTSAMDNDEPTGLCFVDTRNLDGETNNKSKQAVEPLVGVVTAPVDCTAVKMFVECEMPNGNTNVFNGKATTEVMNTGNVETAITLNNMFLRCTSLRNTKRVYGLVVNTGYDTKISMSGNKEKSAKSSTVERQINQQVFPTIFILICLCVIGGVGEYWWSNNAPGHWYIDIDTQTNSGSSLSLLLNVMYYLNLLSGFIPVSLYVSITMVKKAQAWFMEQDLNMYDDTSDTPAMVRNMTLNEQLGDISYVFSDKTGTLTQNLMEFHQTSINGKLYGHRKNADISAMPPLIEFVNFNDNTLFQDLEGTSGAKQRMFIEEFMLVMGVCHTITAECIDGNTKWCAESPDETALVSGAKYCGYGFHDRKVGKIILDVTSPATGTRGTQHDTPMHSGRPGRSVSTANGYQGALWSFDVLTQIEFNSDRKRMSVIVRSPEGKLVLYTKGADTVMWPRITAKDAEEKDMHETTTANVLAWSEIGLRTLLMARKDLDEAFVKGWIQRHKAAIMNPEEISKQQDLLPNLIDELEDELEGGMTLIGASAIEDKLQDGVPEAIADLSKAGIKVWMLTGDKQETAINISNSCRLIDPGTEIVKLTEDDAAKGHAFMLNKVSELADGVEMSSAQYMKQIKSEGWSVKAVGESLRRGSAAALSHLQNPVAAVRRGSAAVGEALHDSVQNIQGMFTSSQDSNESGVKTKVRPKWALVVDGGALTEIMSTEECGKQLFRLIQLASAVVACRVTPSQKAAMIRLVKKHDPAGIVHYTHTLYSYNIHHTLYSYSIHYTLYTIGSAHTRYRRRCQ